MSRADERLPEVTEAPLPAEEARGRLVRSASVITLLTLASRLTGYARDQTIAVVAPKQAELTKPYFSRPNLQQSYYDIKEAKFLNRPLAPYPLTARLRLSFDGVPFEIAQVVQSVKRVTGSGTVFQPLSVGPSGLTARSNESSPLN